MSQRWFCLVFAEFSRNFLEKSPVKLKIPGKKTRVTTGTKILLGLCVATTGVYVDPLITTVLLIVTTDTKIFLRVGVLHLRAYILTA